MTSNPKLLQAYDDVKNMEKHFESAIFHMTDALNEKADEIEVVNAERQYFKEMSVVLSVATCISYFAGYWIARFVSC